jgi:DNA-binding transcriptional MerR regulator
VEERLTVGRVAGLAGVTVRTLHHYDEINLVRPSARTAAGYRAYSADDPGTDAIAHLRRLRGLLLEQRDRADVMVTAIDRELRARETGETMTPEEQLGMFGAQLYDAIGRAYPATRRTDPRIAAQVWDALGDARSVLNVGAGTGSYEPPDRDVTAVEPSAVMRALRPESAAPCVAAVAENLPFEDQSFDAAMAFSTVHHWQDRIAGLREMRRVARRVVVLTYDASEFAGRHRFWLTRDLSLDHARPQGRAAGGAQPPRRPRLRPVG